MDNVHELNGHCSLIVHCLPGQCPWTPWKLSKESVESVNIVHGWKVWTLSTDAFELE